MSPGLSSYRRAFSRSSSTLICGSSFCSPAFVSTSPGVSEIRLTTPSASSAEDLRLGPEDAHDDRAARAGEDLLDALAQVGLHVALHARIAVDGARDGRERLVVVGVLVDRDPVLAEVHAVDLVAEQRLADVRAAVAHAGDLLQVLAGRHRDAVLLLDVRRRLGEPVHEEVALLEVRQQLRPQRRVDEQARQRRHEREADRRAGAAQDDAQHRAVAALEDAQQRRLARAHAAREHEQAQRRRHGHRDRHRDEHRERVGEHERLEERSRQPGQEQHRDDRDDVDDRRVGDRGPHLDGGVEHDPERRSRRAARRAPGAGV